jgi:transcriptional regulator GlxA family with amidase domain
MTPLEYLKHLRLNEARMRLLTGDHDVAEVVSQLAMYARRNSAANTAACSASPSATHPPESSQQFADWPDASS